MRIVIDTNVLISGVFFGGFPRKILSSVVSQKITACPTAEIIDEYEDIVFARNICPTSKISLEILTAISSRCHLKTQVILEFLLVLFSMSTPLYHSPHVFCVLNI